MLVLSAADMLRALPMADAIAAVRKAFVELATGTAVVPQRPHIDIIKHEGTAFFMPGYLAQADALAVKTVTVHRRNPERGLPAIHGVVVLFDPATGRPLSLMEGAALTALRTGAASGLATDLLSRKDSSEAAIFGAGVQARTQLQAICAVRPIKLVHINARRPQNVDEFIAALQPRMNGVQLVPAPDPVAAIRNADIVCAATTSHTPVFHGADLKRGAHVNGVGSYTPTMQEVGTVTLRRASKIVADTREGAMAEAGDLILGIERGAIRASDIIALGDIVNGARPGREREDEITFFKSVGHAALDVAAAQAAYTRASEQGIGTRVSL